MQNRMRQNKGEIEKDRRELRFTKRQKKINVDRCRIEWDRNGESEKDRRELRLTKRSKRFTWIDKGQNKIENERLKIDLIDVEQNEIEEGRLKKIKRWKKIKEN